MTQNYILYSVQYRESSQVSHQPAYKTIWIDPDTLDEYVCWIDTANRNFKHWAAILEQDNPLGIYTGLRTRCSTHRGQLSITADSQPNLLGTFTKSEISEYIKETSRTLTRPANIINTKNNFWNLFELSGNEK